MLSTCFFPLFAGCYAEQEQPCRIMRWNLQVEDGYARRLKKYSPQHTEAALSALDRFCLENM